MPLGVGSHIDRYELLAPLREGGQGSVWRARDRLPPREERALKLVPLVGLSPVALERTGPMGQQKIDPIAYGVVASGLLARHGDECLAATRCVTVR